MKIPQSRGSGSGYEGLEKSRWQNPENPRNRDLFLSRDLYPRDSRFFVTSGFFIPGSGFFSWDVIFRLKANSDNI